MNSYLNQKANLPRLLRSLKNYNPINSNGILMINLNAGTVDEVNHFRSHVSSLFCQSIELISVLIGILITKFSNLEEKNDFFSAWY